MAIEPVYFTTKIAQGRVFCNRVKERELLTRNIEKGQHTVVVAPRRYGKTSLITKVLKETRVYHANIDLFCAVYTSDVAEKITLGISELVQKLIPLTEKTYKVIEECFKNSFIAIKAGTFEIKFQHREKQSNPLQDISNALDGLEKLAAKQKKHVVVFIDEFQDLLKTDQSNQIQATIRAMAQKSTYTSFIFSGSSRFMLKKIFDDRNQPLYMLCKKINLNRIHAEDFTKHLQSAAKKKWKISLDTAVVNAILETTELHSYYVNLLCDLLWENKTPPTEKSIQSAWDDCLLDQKDKLIADLEPLNTNRIKVLSSIARLGIIKEPNSKHFTEYVGLPLSSTQKALSHLLNHDYIRIDVNNVISLVDPILKKFIIKIT